MDAFEAYREPSVKAEPRWAGREDIVDRMTVGDGYRVRRSPGKTPREGISISYILEMGIMLESYQVWNSPRLNLFMFSLTIIDALRFVSTMIAIIKSEIH